MKSHPFSIFFSLLIFPLSFAVSQQYNLSIGDKWILRGHYVDIQGHDTSWDDTLVVEKDTLISSKQYFILNGPFYRIVRNDQHFFYVFLNGVELPLFKIDVQNDTSYSVGDFTVKEYVRSYKLFDDSDSSKIYWFNYTDSTFQSGLQFSIKYGPISFWRIGNSWDYYVTKCFINGKWYPNTTSVANTNINSPTLFRLFQNYPNPFNPTTTISFTLPKTQFVKLTVFNLLGQEIASLLNVKLLSGEHQVEFNAEKLSSGVYLYRIETEEYIQTKKLILLK